MCGRAAQTLDAANLAGASLGATPNNFQTSSGSSINQGSSHDKSDDYELKDNYNMSPGMDAIVMWKEDGKIRMDRKVWGLVTKGGTQQRPLPSDSKARMSLHFQNLMYNARSDTLYSKPTFSRLASQGRSCVVALDGYFEWKSSPLAGDKGKKQPYFVYQKIREETKKQPYLLMAGLWNRVSTGLSEESTLDTFTILTTEACQQIQWLHHRMPVCIWDMKLALQWMDNPSAKIHQALDQAARLKNEEFDWHMVTTAMSSLKFRDKASIQAMKVQTKSVTAYFQKSPVTKQSRDTKKATPSTAEKSQEKEAAKQAMKRVTSSPSKSPSPKKKKPNTATPKPKKGLITSFFQKKG